MSKQTFKVNEKVFVKDWNQYGIVTEVDHKGNPKLIKVGDTIIRAIDFVIEKATLISNLIRLIKSLFNK